MRFLSKRAGIKPAHERLLPTGVLAQCCARLASCANTDNRHSNVPALPGIAGVVQPKRLIIVSGISVFLVADERHSIVLRHIWENSIPK